MARRLDVPRIVIACALALVLPPGLAAAEEAPVTAGEAFALEMQARLEGRPGPAIALTTLDGEVIDLARSYGRKPVYLKMWATWCTACLAQMPHLEAAYDRLRDDFTVVAVATGFDETEEEVRAFVAQKGLKTPVAIDDGRLAAALGLRVTPTHVVIGRDGRILHVGQRADERLEAALVEAAQRPADPAVAGAEPGAAAILSRLPEKTLTTIDGVVVRLAPGEGEEPTALVFLVPWCEGYFAQSRPDEAARCRAVREEAERLRAEGGARWIGVASGLWSDEAEVARYRDERGVSMPLVLDASDELFRGFGIRTTPAVLVFAPDGSLAARIEDPGVDLRTALEIARR